jgi:hypothetical protein
MADGYQLVDVQQDLKSDTTEIVLRLPDGGVVQGTVVDQTGKPLVDVGVSATPFEVSMSRFNDVKTDERGQFTLRYVPLNDQFRVHASKKEYQHFRQELSLNGETSSQLTIRLLSRPSGGDITALVVDSRDKPVVGAEIKNYSNSSAEFQTATTDAAGQFTIRNLYLRDQRPDLVIRAEGFAPQRVFVPQPGKSDIASMKIQLKTGHRIKGRVTDPRGAPIQGAWIFYGDGHMGFGGIGGKLVSDKDGRFASNSLPDDGRFNIWAQGFSEQDGTKLPRDRDQEVLVVMEPSAKFRGRVLDARTGLTIQDFNVKLKFPTITPQGAKKPTSMNADWIEKGRTIQDRDGNFAWDNLSASTAYDLEVSAEGYGTEVIKGVVAIPDPIEIRVQLNRVQRD